MDTQPLFLIFILHSTFSKPTFSPAYSVIHSEFTGFEWPSESIKDPGTLGPILSFWMISRH